MIPDEAVETLARVLAGEALFNADIAGTGWDAETDSSDHFMPNARKRAIEYLEAAAPHIVAQVAEAVANGLQSWGGVAERAYVEGFDEAARDNVPE